MKVALLGLNHPHSEILLTTLQNLTEITTVVLWDADPEIVAHSSLAQRKKASPPTSDLDAVLAQPDLIFAIVCARHDQAAAICLRVVQAGKHLLAEKPVGFSVQEIVQVQEAAARSQVMASVLYCRRAHPCVVRARELLHQGLIGPLMSVECRFLATQVRFRDPTSWLFRSSQAGGGMLLWLGCHCLDLLHYISGDEITEVAAMLAIRSGEPIDVEDTVALALRFRSGAIGTFNAGYTLAFSGEGYTNLKGYDSHLGFNGRQGRVVWPDLAPRLYVESPSSDGTSPIREEQFNSPASTSYGGSGGENFIRQFILATQRRATAPSSLGDALRVARIVAASVKSSASGHFVKV